MKLEKWALSAEIVGSVAVVVTLAILIFEVRGNTSAIQAQTVQAAATLDQDFLLVLGSDPAVAEMWATFLESPESLSRAQQLQGIYLIGALLRRFENLILQRRLGSLSEEGWESRQPLFVGIARSEGYSRFLESFPATFVSDDLLEFMNGLRSGE